MALATSSSGRWRASEPETKEGDAAALCRGMDVPNRHAHKGASRCVSLRERPDWKLLREQAHLVSHCMLPGVSRGENLSHEDEDAHAQNEPPKRLLERFVGNFHSQTLTDEDPHHGDRRHAKEEAPLDGSS